MRSLILVDSDNFLAADAKRGRSRFFPLALSFIKGRVMGSRAGETTVIVGGSRGYILEAMGSWDKGLPVPRFLLGEGVDGTDKQLISVLEDESVLGRYGHIVMMSGDSIYAPVIDSLHSADSSLVSEVVATSRGLSGSYLTRYRKKTPYKHGLVRLSDYVGGSESDDVVK